MARTEIDILEAIEPPCAHHQVAHRRNHGQPGQCGVPGLKRIAASKMDYGRNHSGPGWNRHSDKVLLTRTPGVRRLRIRCDVETRQAAGSGH